MKISILIGTAMLFGQLVTCSCSVVHLWECVTARFLQSFMDMWISLDSHFIHPGRNWYRTSVPWNIPWCSPKAVLPAPHRGCMFLISPALACRRKSRLSLPWKTRIYMSVCHPYSFPFLSLSLLLFLRAKQLADLV